MITLDPYYREHYRELYPALLAIMLHGIRVDLPLAKKLYNEFAVEKEGVKDKLDELADGFKLYAIKRSRSKLYTKHLAEQKRVKERKAEVKGDEEAVKALNAALKELAAKSREIRASGAQTTFARGSGLSDKKLKEFFYETLGFRTRRRGGKMKLDKTALMTLRREHPERAPLIDTIIRHRKLEKLMDYTDASAFDSDGRFRFTLRPAGTTTGRLASNENPRGTGYNSQNIDRLIKRIFVPDEGKFFLEADLSQVEDRIFKVLTSDPELIALAKRDPREFDVHRYMASEILGTPPEQVTSEKRHTSKRLVYLTNYDGQPQRMSEVLISEGVPTTVEECARFRDAYYARFPGIPLYKARLKMQVIEHRELQSSWGTVIRFADPDDYARYTERMDDELFKQCYAWRPQHEAGRLLLLCGIKPLYDHIRENGLESRINLTVHDSLVVSTTLAEWREIARFVKEHLEASRVYDGVELGIPVAFRLGMRYGEGFEFYGPDEVSDEQVMEALKQ